MVSAQARLEQVRYAVQRGLSQRRACALMRAARSGLHYELRMPVKDAPVIEAMKDLSGQFPRFGARRIHIFLARQGIEISKDRCSRIWSAAGLQVPPRKKRRRGVARSSPRPMSAIGRNSVWCYDFVFDSCANGQPLKCLTVVDEYTRECLAIDVAGSIRSKRVIDVLSRFITIHGAPRYLRSDNGPEFVSLALLQWAKDERLESVLSEPGKPWQNGTNESFNGKFRNECLAMEWFRIRLKAQVIIQDWVGHYTEIRPHSSLKYRTKAEFIAGLTKNLSIETMQSSCA